MFIVGLMIALFSVYRMGDLVDAKSEVTMVKTNAPGEKEIIVKKGHEDHRLQGQRQDDGGRRRAARHRVPPRERADHLRAGGRRCATEARRSALLICCLAVALCILAEPATRSAAQQPRKIKIAFLYSDGNMPGTLKAYKALLEERPDLKSRSRSPSSPSRCSTM